MTVEFIDDDDPREEMVALTVSFSAYEARDVIKLKYSEAISLIVDWQTKDKRRKFIPNIYLSHTGVICLDLAQIARINVAVRNQRRFYADIQKALV